MTAVTDRTVRCPRVVSARPFIRPERPIPAAGDRRWEVYVRVLTSDGRLWLWRPVTWRLPWDGAVSFGCQAAGNLLAGLRAFPVHQVVELPGGRR